QAGDADIVIAIDPAERGELATTAKLTIADVGATATARVAIPDRMFDPDAWRGAGRALLREGTVEIADTAVDPKLLPRFGIDAAVPGRFGIDGAFRAGVGAKLTVGAALASVHVVADVRDVHGGAIAKPVAIHAEVTADSHGTCTDADITSVRPAKPRVAP